MVPINTAVTLSPALSPQGRGSVRGYGQTCVDTFALKGRELHVNFMTHLVAGLVAYALLPEHASLNLGQQSAD
jgi:hypothetical protein